MTRWTRALRLALMCGFAILGASAASAAVLNLSATFSPNADTVPLVIGPGLTFQTSTFESVPTPSTAMVAFGDTINFDYSLGGKAIVFGGNGVSPESFQLRFQGQWFTEFPGVIDNVVGTFTGVTGQLLPAVALGTNCDTACFLVSLSGNLTNTGFSFTGGTVSFRIAQPFTPSPSPILSVEGFAISTDLRVQETPLPAALPLFGTGLGLMGIVGWWRKRRADAAA